MKCHYSLLLLLTLITACTDHSIEKQNSLPLKEIHYKLETGEIIAEKTFSYDDRNNLITEEYRNFKSSSANNKLFYEYDTEGRRIRFVTAFPGIAGMPGSEIIVKYFYDGDRKVSEEHYGYSIDKPYKIFHFMGQSLQPDSVLDFNFIVDKDVYEMNIVTYFQYDDQQRLTEEKIKYSSGFTIISKQNTYTGNLLSQTCNPVAGIDNVFNCTKRIYNSRGQLFRVYATLTGAPDKLLEEYYYDQDLLLEKRIFDQHSAFPTYQPDPIPFTLQVKYEY